MTPETEISQYYVIKVVLHIEKIMKRANTQPIDPTPHKGVLFLVPMLCGGKCLGGYFNFLIL
jgi:hypothetical protein